MIPTRDMFQRHVVGVLYNQCDRDGHSPSYTHFSQNQVRIEQATLSQHIEAKFCIKLYWSDFNAISQIRNKSN